jgi:hypothetical protein
VPDTYSKQFKSISIRERRETAAVCIQVVFRKMHHLFDLGGTKQVQRLSQVIECNGVAAVFQAIAVHSNSINPNHVSLVFYRSGFKKRFPCVCTPGRPVGNVDQQVIGIRNHIPAPNRKTEVITNKRTYFPPFPFNDQSGRTGRIGQMLTSVTEQVALVVLTI